MAHRVLMHLTWILLLLAAPAALAQSESPDVESDSSEAEAEPRHGLSVFLGGTTTEEVSAFTIGLDYQYRVSSAIGVGVLVDHAAGDIKSTLVAAALFLHYKQWEATVAPAVEFHGDSEEETAMAFRIGLGYELSLGSYGIVPAVFFDTERAGEPAFVYGVALGMDF